MNIILSFLYNIFTGIVGNCVYDKLNNRFGKQSKTADQDTSAGESSNNPLEDDVIDISDIVGIDKTYEKSIREEIIRNVASKIITFTIIFSILAVIIFLTYEVNKWLQSFSLPVFISIPCALQIVLYLPAIGLHLLDSDGKRGIISAFLTLACLSFPVGTGIWLWSKGTPFVPTILLPAILSVIMFYLLYNCYRNDK